MPIQIRVMSWNIQKKQTNARFIAAAMRAHQIDICALLEVPNGASGTIPTRIITELNNINPAYFRNEWTYHSVNVGNEAVTYIWHQNAVAGANAFMADTCINSPARVVAGKVLKSAANNATIYFPTTKFKWASLPGTPAGRRPAYISFVTNDGQAPRRFTVLDIHTPFNPDTFIQSYATHLYASSREIVSVERFDPVFTAQGAAAGLPANLAVAVDPLLTGVTNYANFMVPLTVRTRAVDAALAAIVDAVDSQGANLPLLFSNAVNEGINAALKAVGAFPGGISVADATLIARGCAMVGSLAATAMVASIQLPTGPAPATADVNAALNAAAGAIINVAAQYAHPATQTAARIRDAIRHEAKRMARAALAPFTFAALPRANVNAAIVAGDFNVHYPDNTGYTQQQTTIMGGGNAYAALAAVAGAAPPNTAATTRKGPTAFEGQRVYTLGIPCLLQNANPMAADTYVPLDLTALINNPTSFMGNDAWIAGLQALPRTGGATWADISRPPYAGLLYDAFDRQVIDDTSFYRTNCYDNFFVRGANVVASGVVDVMSELGSWGQGPALPNPQGPPAANPWPAAAATLNPFAQAQLNQAGAVLQYTYNGISYTITPALADAEEAAVFFDRFISDHLPVAVAVQI
jgi:endonuclease/exonuclease/phosphatase family metal-dependent hydrolase